MKKKMTWSALARFISRETSPEEEEAISAWIDEDKSNDQLVYDTLQMVENNRLEFPHFDVNRGKRLLHSKMAKEKKVSLAKTRKMRWMGWAAIFLAITSVSGYLIFAPLYPQKRLTEVVTLPGEKYSLRLPDGTLATLNSGSKLTYAKDFGETVRKIQLSGEAFFDVHPDKQKPFIIEARELTIEVVGTAFNVKANPGDKESTVAVSEGIVNVTVTETGGQFDLTRNQKATFHKISGDLTKNETDLLMELAWMNNRFIFKDTSLGDAVAQLERSFGIPVRFENDNIGRCVVTGRFDETSLRKIIMSICYSNDLDYEFREGFVLLKGKGC